MRGVAAAFCWTAAAVGAAVQPCALSSSAKAWPFSVAVGKSYSCSSEMGGINDMGSTPTQCQGDPASVRIQVTPGKAECLVAKAEECKIPMHDFVSLDYDFAVSQCNGVWAAPLWMTPDTWQWGGGSGEIDSLEFCARDGIHMNFAGGGHQVSLPQTDFNTDSSSGHVTVRKDVAGIVTIVACSAEEAASSLAQPGQCAPPSYTDCNDCQGRSNNSFACWCNGDKNIYGSGGCQPNTDCQWTLVSDIWNGLSGDAGYAGCMTAVPGVVEEGKPNLDSRCALSVEKITVRGGGPAGSIRWGAGSPSACSVLTPPASGESGEGKDGTPTGNNSNGSAGTKGGYDLQAIRMQETLEVLLVLGIIACCLSAAFVVVHMRRKRRLLDEHQGRRGEEGTVPLVGDGSRSDDLAGSGSPFNRLDDDEDDEDDRPLKNLHAQTDSARVDTGTAASGSGRTFKRQQQQLVHRDGCDEDGDLGMEMTAQDELT